MHYQCTKAKKTWLIFTSSFFPKSGNALFDFQSLHLNFPLKGKSLAAEAHQAGPDRENQR